MFKLDSVKQPPGGVTFASDPLFVNMSEGINVLHCGDGREFRCRLSSAGSVNVSDIVEAWADYLPEPAGTSWLERVEAWDVDCPRYVYYGTIRTRPGQPSRRLFASYVIPGRSSLQNLELLDGNNLFAARLLNDRGNPFLTTRTHKSLIIVMETELAPLYFIQDKTDPESIVVELGSGISAQYSRGTLLLEDSTDGTGVYTIDLQKIRREVFDVHGLLASSFIIRKGGQIAAEIFIEGAAAAMKRHRLKFRNSFGVFEIIELTGKLTNETQFVDANEFKKFRLELNRFDNERRRPSLESSLSVSTGPKCRRQLLHLLDCLASDEVWLLDYGPAPLKVIPEVKSLKIPERQDEPQSADLILHPVYSEPAIMPDISRSNASYMRKLFTNSFDNKFT